MSDDFSSDFDLPPDPSTLPGAKIPLSNGSTIDSAVSSTVNTSLDFIRDNFDPTISYTGSSAAATAPPGPDSSTSISFQPVKRGWNQIYNNPLDAYMDVTYNISLAMASPTAMTGSSSDYVVFASTADAKTNSMINSSNGGVPYNGNYYNIQGLSFTTLSGNEPQNPMICSIWDGKMKIFEPYGFQLIDDFDTIAKSLSYPSNVARQNFTYRMEIWFSGWDAVTGAWTSHITIPNPQPGNSANTNASIVYYMCITAIEATTTATGTFYDISLQPVSHSAYRPENIILRQDNMSQKISVSGQDKFSDFLFNLANRLSDQIYNETDKKIRIIFEFVGLKQLMDAKFDAAFDVPLTNNYSGNSSAAAAKNIDLLTLINSVMNNLPFVKENLLKTDDVKFIQPTVLWHVHPRITQAEGPDQTINNYTKLTFQYTIEPVFTFKTRMTDLDQQAGTVTADSQKARLSYMLNAGMLFRWYDYLFTSGNSEIIDFKIFHKNFYYQAIPTDEARNLRSVNQNTKDDPVVGQQPAQAEASQGEALLLGVSSTGAPDQDFIVNQILGGSAQTYSTASKVQSRGRGQGQAPQGANATAASKKAEYDNKAHLAFDDLRNDMIVVTMTARLDPRWVMNSYMDKGDSTATLASGDVSAAGGGQTTSINANVDKIIYINTHAPNQKSFMSNDPSLFSANTPSIIAGLYQVIKVTAHFDGAKFYLVFDKMVKYNHMNYAEVQSQTNDNTAGQKSSRRHSYRCCR